MPKAEHFGDVNHIDLIQVEDAAGVKFWCLNIVDAASKFQLVALVPDKSAGSVIALLEDRWLSWAGPPKRLIADHGCEFIASETVEWAEANIVPVHGAWLLLGGLGLRRRNRRG